MFGFVESYGRKHWIVSAWIHQLAIKSFFFSSFSVKSQGTKATRSAATNNGFVTNILFNYEEFSGRSEVSGLQSRFRRFL